MHGTVMHGTAVFVAVIAHRRQAKSNRQCERLLVSTQSSEPTDPANQSYRLYMAAPAIESQGHRSRQRVRFEYRLTILSVMASAAR